jgi:hypothetical protein
VTGPLTALYLAGSRRSGSTIVDNVLGEIPGFFSGGELRFVWDRNMRDDRVCGCGEPFSRCALWQEVMRAAYGDDVPPVEDVVGWRERAIRVRSAPVAGLAGTRERLRQENARYLETLEKFYHGTTGVTGARVVVDSSKYPSYGYLLSLIDSLDVVMIHVVRDPRAVAYSWTRTKLEVTTEGVTVPMGRVSRPRTAMDWMLWSVLAEQFGRCLSESTTRGGRR